MEFRIVELNDAKENKKVFLIQVGKVIWEPWIFGLKRRKIVWDYYNKEGEKADTFVSFKYALEEIEEIKRQLPIYHRIK